jgi:hypothetical protein
MEGDGVNRSMLWPPKYWTDKSIESLPLLKNNGIIGLTL